MDSTHYAGYHYYRSAHEGRGCDPAAVRAFRGILIAVALSVLMWVPIVWLIL